jgi:hypothetical protein
VISFEREIEQIALMFIDKLEFRCYNSRTDLLQTHCDTACGPSAISHFI